MIWSILIKIGNFIFITDFILFVGKLSTNSNNGPKTNRNQITKIGNFWTDFTLFVGKLSTNGDNGPKTNGNQTSNCTNAKNGAKKEESDLHQDAVELKPLTDQGEIAKAVQEPKPKPPPPSTISVNESR